MDMRIKEVRARSIFDSRQEETIEVSVLTEVGDFISSAPSGKSKGRFEAKPYAKSLKEDIKFLNDLKPKSLDKFHISEFKDLKEIEGFIGSRVGANTLFALESSVLKALAKEQGKELWELLSRGRPKIFPMPVGNAIEGGMHSSGKRPDFQEFLFIPETKKFKEAVELNKKSHALAGKLLNSKEKGDEGGWKTGLDNSEVLQIMNKVKDKMPSLKLGIDAAASTFYKNKKYIYKNKAHELNEKQQINYIAFLSKVFRLEYIEDPLEEENFQGFSELQKQTKAMIVGDDLTVTNLHRLKKAKQTNSIKGVIVKPNQNGSLIQVKEICEYCHKNNIKIIFSHRSGETQDTTIADLALAWKADYIKTGISGKEREAKLRRLVEIEQSI